MNNTQKIHGLSIVAILLIASFSLLQSSGGGGQQIPTSFTYTITSSNTYNAYSTTSLSFTELNFSRLMNDDIISSSQCSISCTVFLNPGSYNLTQGIAINKPVSIYGSPSSKIISQNLTTYNAQPSCAGSFRPLFCITSSNIVFSGFSIDDHNRDNTLNVAGDDIAVGVSSSNGLIQSMTIVNASSNAINIQGSNYIVTTCTITGFHTGSGGNYGILTGSTTTSVRIFLNSISSFNGTDVSGIQTSNGASYISITSNNLFFNSFGISSTWGKFVTIEANLIHDNYAGGMLLTTGAIGSISAGPLTINDNIITNNAKEPGLDVQCNNQHCPGIMIKGVRPSWDGVTIISNAIKDTQATPTQYYGINIISTNYSNLTITGDTLGRTVSGTTINLGVNPLKSWIIAENPGFNPQPIRGPLTAGATPFTYTNNDGYKEQIELITIGDMTAFTCRGIANIIQVDAISPILNTLDTCVFTYVTIAPTYDVLPT